MNPSTISNHPGDQRIRQALLAQIHIAQRDLQLDEAAYRLLLQRLTGRNSCAEMNLTQLQAVRREMVLRGFKPVEPWQWVDHAAVDRRPLLRQIIALANQAHVGEGYVNSLARRISGKERLAFCNGDELHDIIAALNVHQRRHPVA